MRLIERESGKGAVVIDVAAAHHGRSKAVRRPVFKTVLLGKQRVEFIALAENVVPARHRLVIPVAAFVIRVEEVIG